MQLLGVQLFGAKYGSCNYSYKIIIVELFNIMQTKTAKDPVLILWTLDRTYIL